MNRSELVTIIVNAAVTVVVTTILLSTGTLIKKVMIARVVPTARRPFSKKNRPLLKAILYFVATGLNLAWSLLDNRPITRFEILRIIVAWCWFMFGLGYLGWEAAWLSHARKTAQNDLMSPSQPASASTIEINH